MVSHLCNPSLLQNNDPVCPSEGSNAVSDKDTCLPLKKSLQPLQDPFFGLNVYGRKGVIQDEEGRIHQNRPGNGDPLPLTSGKGDPLLPDQGIEALRETP